MPGEDLPSVIHDPVQVLTRRSLRRPLDPPGRLGVPAGNRVELGLPDPMAKNREARPAVRGYHWYSVAASFSSAGPVSR